MWYFNSKKQGEVDFVLEQDDEIIPLEVKSGKDFQRHLALNNVMGNKGYAINRAIVLCNENLSIKDDVLYAPVYMTMFLYHQNPQGPIIYHPEVP